MLDNSKSVSSRRYEVASCLNPIHRKITKNPLSPPPVSTSLHFTHVTYCTLVGVSFCRQTYLFSKKNYLCLYPFCTSTTTVCSSRYKLLQTHAVITCPGIIQEPQTTLKHNENPQIAALLVLRLILSFHVRSS